MEGRRRGEKVVEGRRRGEKVMEGRRRGEKVMEGRRRGEEVMEWKVEWKKERECMKVMEWKEKQCSVSVKCNEEVDEAVAFIIRFTFSNSYFK